MPARTGSRELPIPQLVEHTDGPHSSEPHGYRR